MIAARLVASVVGAACLLGPSVALACPACAQREGGGWALFFVYAAMILTPFVAVAVVHRLVKRLTSGGGAVPPTAVHQEELG